MDTGLCGVHSGPDGGLNGLKRPLNFRGNHRFIFSQRIIGALDIGTKAIQAEAEIHVCRVPWSQVYISGETFAKVTGPGRRIHRDCSGQARKLTAKRSNFLPKECPNVPAGQAASNGTPGFFIDAHGRLYGSLCPGHFLRAFLPSDPLHDVAAERISPVKPILVRHRIIRLYWVGERPSAEGPHPKSLARSACGANRRARRDATLPQNRLCKPLFPFAHRRFRFTPRPRAPP